MARPWAKFSTGAHSLSLWTWKAACEQPDRASPLCIRTRVNRARGVRAVVRQECCKPSRAAACGAGQQQPGQAGQVPPLAGGCRDPPTPWEFSTQPSPRPALFWGGQKGPPSDMPRARGELVSLLAKPRSHGWKEELPIALSLSNQLLPGWKPVPRLQEAPDFQPRSFQIPGWEG